MGGREGRVRMKNFEERLKNHVKARNRKGRDKDWGGTLYSRKMCDGEQEETGSEYSQSYQ